MPTLEQLMNALPEVEETSIAMSTACSPLQTVSLRPVPLGRFRRLGLMGTLQARIAAAYFFYWLRSWFQKEQENERKLSETHWKTAVRLLDSMSYLRGAFMKAGQTLASFPEIAPSEFVETLEQLHFTAPPMHWSLLREMVINELGDEPENLFAEFDKRAFAAASLGQVHRARLKTGEEVAVKIQYPGIAPTISEDISNLFLFLLPGRLSRDWQNMRAQFEDLQRRLEGETDYVQEAAFLQQARSLFRDEDGIVVPRVHPHFSTTRILTMDLVPGVHLDQFLARQPSQSERNEAATKMIRAWYRLMYAGRMLYIDYHQGNFLFLDDGRLGLVDFGGILPLDDELWELFRIMDRSMTTGLREDRIDAMKAWSGLTDETTDQMNLYAEFAEWTGCARYTDALYDFGQEADFRHGVRLFTEMVRKRYSRSHQTTPTIARGNFAWRSLLYQLRAQINIRPIAESEVTATGWDRSAYLSSSPEFRPESQSPRPPDAAAQP